MIRAPVVEHRACGIATCGIYVVILRASVLRNGFLILPRGILHEDFKNAILLEPTIRSFSINVRV